MRNRFALAIAFVFVIAALPVQAGPYGDDLAKCLVDKTSDGDKTTLVKWFFAMAALHPDVQSISAVTPQQRDGLNHDVAEIFQRLLTESCKAEAKKAMKYEQQTALESSFGVLGQVAAQGLFTDPGVEASMGEFTKYMDEQKLKGIFPKE